MRNSPAAQPTTEPRWSRQARPNGAAQAAVPRGRARAGPRGRRSRSRGAGTRRTPPRPRPPRPTSSSRAGHQRSPENACMAWYHPIGESQLRARVADVADGPQDVGEADHRAGDAVHRAGAGGELRGDQGDAGEDPAAQRQADAEGERVRDRERVGDQAERDQHAERARWRAARSTSAAVIGACRPTAAARSSSSRPLSSSARVCRPTRNMLISPAHDRAEGGGLPGRPGRRSC